MPMQTHTEIWGHVALNAPTTAAFEKAQEALETQALRCRHARIRPCPQPSECGSLPVIHGVIFNPNTLRGIAEIFGMPVEEFFSLAISAR